MKINIKNTLLILIISTTLIFTSSCSFNRSFSVSKNSDTEITADADNNNNSDNSKDSKTAKDSDKSDNSNESKNNSDSDDSKNSDKTSAEAVAEQEAFDTYMNELFVDVLSASNLNAHAIVEDFSKYNITDTEYTLGGLSQKEYLEDLDINDEVLEELGNFDYELLTEEQQLTYDIIYEDTTAAQELKDAYYLMENSLVSPSSGFALNFPSYMAQLKLDSVEDIEDYLKNMELIPDYFSEIETYERTLSEKGMFMPDFEAEDVIEQINNFTSSTDDNLLITTFDSRIKEADFLDDAKKNEYIEKNKSYIINSIIPAYNSLKDVISELKGTGVEDGGLGNLPGGPEYYEYLVASHIGNGMTIEELRDYLQDAFSSSATTMMLLQAADEDIYDKMSVYDNISTTDYDAVIQKLTEITDKYYPAGYSKEYTINYVDSSLEDYAAPAYYFIPPIDNTDHNNIYINNSKIYDEDNPYDIIPVLAHEGYPGHLYQTTYYRNLNPSPIRSIFSFDGYTEGWGLYSELNIHEYLGQDSSVCKYAKAINTYAYSAYSIADIMVNYDGATKDDVVDYMTDTVGYDEETAVSIYESIVEDPAGTMCYLMGFLKFEDLKKEAKSTLGDDFDLKEFHEFILNLGPCQLDILEERFNEWIY